MMDVTDTWRKQFAYVTTRRLCKTYWYNFVAEYRVKQLQKFYDNVVLLNQYYKTHIMEEHPEIVQEWSERIAKQNVFEYAVCRDRWTVNDFNQTKNMRLFNLEEAKAGKKVVTRNGRAVRIIADDSKGYQPIIALVMDDNASESTFSYSENGSFFRDGSKHILDLFMAPTRVTKWVNILQGRGLAAGVYSYAGNNLYESEQQAICGAPVSCDRIATIPVTYEV